MYQIDLNSKIHVHFIGIGGISMSGLAEILLNRGFTVSGSDGKASPLTDSLAGKGCKIAIGQKAENITDDIDLVVYTAAIHKDNPEFAEAVNRKLPMLTRAELLGQIMKGFPLSVAVAGTHGKTTTTSMLTSILLAADADPTISVGGMHKEIGGNIRIGNSDYFVTEACEYTNSFLSLFPKIAVILNIEEDHLDFFEDLRDIRNSFQKFAGLLPEDGVLILHSGIDQPDEIIKATPKGASVLTFGLPDAGPENAFPCYSCKDISFDSAGCASYTLLEKDEEAGRIKLSVPGEHNITNSLAAIAAARALEIDLDAIRKGLESFTGTDRRFEFKGTVNGVNIIDDYAHHPTEIRATLRAAEKYPHKRLWCVFQPHTYSRTRAFFDDFADALRLADRVILADIYAARETDTLGMSSKLLSEAINKASDTPKALYLDSFEKIEEYLRENCVEGDLILTMGAGNIVTVGEELLAHR